MIESGLRSKLNHYGYYVLVGTEEQKQDISKEDMSSPAERWRWHELRQQWRWWGMIRFLKFEVDITLCCKEQLTGHQAYSFFFLYTWWLHIPASLPVRYVTIKSWPVQQQWKGMHTTSRSGPWKPPVHDPVAALPPRPQQGTGRTLSPMGGQPNYGRRWDPKQPHARPPTEWEHVFHVNTNFFYG